MTLKRSYDVWSICVWNDNKQPVKSSSSHKVHPLTCIHTHLPSHSHLELVVQFDKLGSGSVLETAASSTVSV